MSLDKGLQLVMTKVPGCVACGLVDMANGMNLAIRTVDSHPAEVIELVGAATADLFQGQTVSMIEAHFKKARGVKDDTMHYIQEVIFLSSNLIHVLLRCKGKGHTEWAMVVVCSMGQNLGMVLSTSRSMLAEVEKSA